MRVAFCTLLAILCPLIAAAATASDLKPSVSLDARGEYQHVQQADTTVHRQSGFKGKLLSLFVTGELTPKFSYAYRQRLNGINRDHSFFDSTDWLWLRWNASPNFSLLAGKWAVLTGTWEMDPPPIDCFQLAEFAYGFPCYAWGLVGIASTNSGHDKFMLQVCQSPFRKTLEHATGRDIDTYAYNLIWQGNHGFWHPMWGVNLIECMPGRYITYIGIGNRFLIGDRATIDLDFLNRSSSGHTYLFRDCSVMLQAQVRASRHVSAFLHGSYDVNRHSSTSRDLAITPGTEIKRLGAGLFLYPLADERLRIHAQYSYSWGTNTSPSAVLLDRQHFINLGVTWKMKLL